RPNFLLGLSLSHHADSSAAPEFAATPAPRAALHLRRQLRDLLQHFLPVLRKADSRRASEVQVGSIARVGLFCTASSIPGRYCGRGYTDRGAGASGRRQGGLIRRGVSPPVAAVLTATRAGLPCRSLCRGGTG